jgi:hypothetical protein
MSPDGKILKWSETNNALYHIASYQQSPNTQLWCTAIEHGLH